MKLDCVHKKWKVWFCVGQNSPHTKSSFPRRIFTKPRPLPRLGFLLHSLDSIVRLLGRTKQKYKIINIDTPFERDWKSKHNIVCFHHNPGPGRGISHIWSLETSPEMAPMAPLTGFLSTTFLEAHGSTRDFTLKVSFCRELFVGAAESRNLGRESCDREGRPRHYHSSLLCPRLPLIDTFNQKTEGPLLHPSKPSSSS